MKMTIPYDNFPKAVAAARAARKQGNLEAAAEIYRLIPSAFAEKKDAVTIAAEGLRDCGHWVEAIGILEAALQKWPKSALYLSSLAEMYREIGDHARAASYLQRYLDYDSRNPEAWLNLARLHDLAGNHAAAENAFAGVLDRDPKSVLAAVGRGNSLFQLDRPDEAIIFYRRAVEIAPQDANALFALGSALVIQGSEIEGREYLKQSLAIETHNARAHVNFGLTYFNTGSAKEAEIAARNALRIDDQLQIAQVLLGMALAEQGDLEGAAAALTKAVSSPAHNVEALFALASVQTALGNKTSAELALQRVLAETPDDSEARHLIDALHGAAISAPRQNYSRTAFDRIASRFDNQELRLRHYSVPAELTNLIEAFQPDRRSIASLVDAGCGTGLMTSSLRDAFAVEKAVGIDASPKMVEVALKAGLYDRLITEDVGNLERIDGAFDILVAGDLFPYLGGLSPFMAVAHARLAPGGLIAYSIELSDGEPLKLSQSGRFLHTVAYVENCARAAGLRPVASRETILRCVFGRNVPGLVGLLQS